MATASYTTNRDVTLKKAAAFFAREAT